MGFIDEVTAEASLRQRQHADDLFDAANETLAMGAEPIDVIGSLCDMIARARILAEDTAVYGIPTRSVLREIDEWCLPDELPRPGDIVEVTDERGTVFDAEVLKVDPKDPTCTLFVKGPHRSPTWVSWRW